MTGDVDLYPSRRVLEILAARTGASTSQVHRTALPDLMGTLFENLPANGLVPWVTYLGNRNHTVPSVGLSYCPVCLREDSIAYCRRIWRMAFATICTSHRVRLVQDCPHCGAPFAIHRWDKGRSDVETGDPITHCQICRMDRTAGIQLVQIEDDGLIEFHWVLDRAIQRGWVNTGGKPIDALPFFAGLGMVAKCLLDRRKCGRLRQELVKRGFLGQLIEHCTKKTRLECLSLPLRHEIMQAIAWLWQDWPGRFIDVCQLAKFKSSYLFDHAPGHFGSVPYWLWEPAHHHLYGKHYAPSDAEVDAVIAILRRKGGSIRKIDVVRLLGVSWLNKRTIKRLSLILEA